MIRFFDFSLSLIGIVMLFPLFVLLWALLFWQARSPLFTQERLGKDKKVFTIFKFRSMRLNTTSTATHFVNENEVTSIGQFLRSSKLDELPQLWNVLKGEMSLVGPRPGLANQVELTAARERLGVFKVLPGITGLAQVSRIDMSTPELLAQTDAEMIAQMSLKNYFKYIFLTFIGKGGGDRIKP